MSKLSGQVWNKAEAGVNTDTVITITPPANKRVALHLVLFGYDDAPTGGRIRVSLDGTERLSLPITQSGPGPLSLPGMNEDAGPGLGAVVVITIDAAGAAVKGSLTTMHTLEN